MAVFADDAEDDDDEGSRRATYLHGATPEGGDDESPEDGGD